MVSLKSKGEYDVNLICFRLKISSCFIQKVYSHFPLTSEGYLFQWNRWYPVQSAATMTLKTRSVKEPEIER